MASDDKILDGEDFRLTHFGFISIAPQQRRSVYTCCLSSANAVAMLKSNLSATGCLKFHSFHILVSKGAQI